MSAFSEFAARLKKPIPRVIEKRKKKADLEAEDRRQRNLCHVRSGGRCEVREVLLMPEASAIVTKRCKGRAGHNHHLLGGVGRRNIGPSLLAAHRLDTCLRCHQDIEAEILVPANRDHETDALLVTYERRKDW